VDAADPLRCLDDTQCHPAINNDIFPSDEIILYKRVYKVRDILRPALASKRDTVANIIGSLFG
jgi:hypothetical protein